MIIFNLDKNQWENVIILNYDSNLIRLSLY
jgi:hypothetical protein